MSKLILITGATDGIGLRTAEKLVKAGHRLVIHGRNENKLNSVEKSLNALGGFAVQSFVADLSNFQSVENLAQEVAGKYSSLDVIINNAGVYKTPTPITADGLDARFVVNTIAPYLLTLRLLPLLNHQARVVNLSSAAQAAVDFDAFVGDREISDSFNAYAQSKLAIVMWTRYLSRALGLEAPLFVALNPGSLLASKMVQEGFGVQGNDLSVGADIIIQASLSERFTRHNGKYFDNDVEGFADPHAFALTDEHCDRLVSAMNNLIEKFN